MEVLVAPVFFDPSGMAGVGHQGGGGFDGRAGVYIRGDSRGAVVFFSCLLKSVSGQQVEE